MIVRHIIIMSRFLKKPIAEVRTDGNMIDFMIDRTEGKLPELVQKQYKKLMELIDSSSDLYLKQPERSQSYLLSYLVNTGDVVEISSDGHTVFINGHLLSEHEKEALFNSIKNREIYVIRTPHAIEQKLSMPIGPLPSHQLHSLRSHPTTESKKAIQYKANNEQMDGFIAQQLRKQQLQLQADYKYDPRIESMDFSDVRDPYLAKRMVYGLVHGRIRGEYSDE